MRKSHVESDSRNGKGGRIPGTPGLPAFTVTGPEPSALPVLIAVPHAGRTYPGGLLKAMRDPQVAALKLEDRYVDRVAVAAARATGATLVVANAPRAMIDLNRAPDDVDWEMFGKADRPDKGARQPSRRARGGLGLIPRRVPGIGELWNRGHREDELAARVREIHDPYHLCLEGTLAEMRDRWGGAVLLDLHSMPPIQQRGGYSAPEFVIGDRFGASSHGGLVAAAFACLHERGRAVAHNRPYSGGYVLERHGSPESGIHALQLEIDRSAYLDSRLVEPGDGFDTIAELLAALIRRLATEAASLRDSGGDARWQEAAE